MSDRDVIEAIRLVRDVMARVSFFFVLAFLVGFIAGASIAVIAVLYSPAVRDLVRLAP